VQRNDHDPACRAWLLVFKQAFGWRDFLGPSLAGAAVVIMRRDQA
jgi:hypothetical protein